MSTKNVENYDDVTMYGLTPEKREHLLLTQNELTFIWTTREGHGMGVTMSYIWRHGRVPDRHPHLRHGRGRPEGSREKNGCRHSFPHASPWLRLATVENARRPPGVPP